MRRSLKQFSEMFSIIQMLFLVCISPKQVPFSSKYGTQIRQSNSKKFTQARLLLSSSESFQSLKFRTSWLPCSLSSHWPAEARACHRLQYRPMINQLSAAGSPSCAAGGGGGSEGGGKYTFRPRDCGEMMVGRSQSSARCGETAQSS